MVIPSSFEGIIEGVSKKIPKLKLSTNLSQCKLQATFIVFPIYFHMISVKHLTTFPKFFQYYSEMITNFLQITTLAT